MFIVLLLLIILLVGYVCINCKTENNNPIQETIQYFKTSSSQWLTPEEVQAISSATDFNSYAAILPSQSISPISNDMLVGQPLKYIWRDKNMKQLKAYLQSLQDHNVSWKDSFQQHSELYTNDFGAWSEGIQTIARQMI